MSKLETPVKVVKSAVQNRAYRYAAILIAFFFASAILGAIIGSFIDKQFDVRPWGSVGTLVISYALSWIIVKFVILRSLNKSNSLNNKSEK